MTALISTLIPTLAASPVPSMPLIWGQFGLMAAIVHLMLVVCVAALWFERERHESLPHPVPFDSVHRLAA